MPPLVNHFARLGISIGANEDEIKKAYRTMAKKWHPDKCSEAGAKEKFQEIAASYEYLSSKDRREMHERELRNPKPTPPPPPKAPPQQSKPTSTSKPSYTYTGASSTTGSSSTSKGPKKPNKASWSETFTKNFQSQQAKQGKTGDASGGSGARTFFFTSSTGGGGADGFTFMFHDSSSERRASAADDIFEELFGDFFSDMGFGAGPGGLSGGLSLGGMPGPKQNKKPRPRNVAPETGQASGLDEEYLFTPSNHDNDPFTEKLPCPWCGQLFTRGKLGQHEEKCGKFGLSADEDEDDDSEDNSDDDIGFYSKHGAPSYSHKPHWERQREEMMAKVRRDKQRYKDRMASQGERNSGYTKCPYCERSYNHVAAAKHIPWCKEHTRNYGRPMNPRMPGASFRDNEHEDIDPETSRSGTRKFADRHQARERGREYAKTIPKPGTIPKYGTKKAAFDSDDDSYDDTPSPRYGNDRKFPYTRAKNDNDFGVNGTRVGGKSYGRYGQGNAPGSAASSKHDTGFGSSTEREKSGAGASASSYSNSSGARGSFNVKFGAKLHTGARKPGAYASSYKTKRL